MASKPLMIATLLGASIGVPYVASRTTSDGKPAGHTSPPMAGASHLPGGPMTPPMLGSSPSYNAPIAHLGSTIQAAPAPPQGARVHPVDQVLRFDITKDWVHRNWDRVSTGPTDVGLLAVRVALVSGTTVSSLAGSLTYYFNTYGQVEHITFRGTTGDAARLVYFLARTYEFQPVSAPVGEKLYQVTRRGRIQSELRTRAESVVKTASPHGSVAVELELARPGTNRYLPPREPSLRIPPGAPAPPPAATQSAANASAGSPSESGASYFDRVRYATPEEEGQVQSKRWPD